MEENLDLLISASEITKRIQEVAEKLNAEYAGKEITLVMVMKGAVCLAADLLRHLRVPCQIDYVQASSYGDKGSVKGDLLVSHLDEIVIQGRHILLVDDIFDTGHTLTHIQEEILKKNPQSLKTCVLLVKEVPRHTLYFPDYVLFMVPSRFVVGYGLDYKELYRGLKGIYAFPKDIPI